MSIVHKARVTAKLIKQFENVAALLKVLYDKQVGQITLNVAYKDRSSITSITLNEELEGLTKGFILACSNFNNRLLSTIEQGWNEFNEEEDI
jgi:hypothetical protein